MAHVDPTHAGDLHFDVGQDRADSHVVVKLAAVGAAQQSSGSVRSTCSMPPVKRLLSTAELSAAVCALVDIDVIIDVEPRSAMRRSRDWKRCGVAPRAPYSLLYVGTARRARRIDRRHKRP
jgi:hypothetical protein